jgi:hypothetical protein
VSLDGVIPKLKGLILTGKYGWYFGGVICPPFPVLESNHGNGPRYSLLGEPEMRDWLFLMPAANSGAMEGIVPLWRTKLTGTQSTSNIFSETLSSAPYALLGIPNDQVIVLHSGSIILSVGLEFSPKAYNVPAINNGKVHVITGLHVFICWLFLSHAFSTLLSWLRRYQDMWHVSVKSTMVQIMLCLRNMVERATWVLWS